MSSTPTFEPVVDLQIAGIFASTETTELFARVLSRVAPGDRVEVSTDLAEGLSAAVAEAADLVFVDVSIGKGAGVAAVHHLRALMPRTTIIALAPAESLPLGTQALALGATGLFLLPLSGDEILSAVAAVRTREAEHRAAERLRAHTLGLTRDARLLSRAGELAQARTRREAAARLCELFAEHVGAASVDVYLPASDGARHLKQIAHSGATVPLPPFCEEMDLLNAAAEQSLEVLKLEVGREAVGLLLLGGGGGIPLEERSPLAPQLATQAATALALISAREQSHRGAMKDPASSAYTFAYFVDVAGREIDKAQRHGRRFALATINVEPPGDPGTTVDQRAVEVIEHVLGSVRATDVLARVDELELYLLLPETGGIGGHVCRRRILRSIAEATAPSSLGPLDVTVGAAMYPLNGTDLSHLLRIAKHRADASRLSVVRTLDLTRRSLAEILDAILAAPRSAEDTALSLERPQPITLPLLEVLPIATTALADARRGGGARVLATHRSGVSIGAALRSTIGREASDVQLELIDLAEVPGYQDVEAIALVAEHGCYVFLGRVERGHVRGMHAADPLLVDLITERLRGAARPRVVD